MTRGWRLARIGLAGAAVYGAGAALAADEPLATGLVEYVEIRDESVPDSSSVATKLPLALERTPFGVGTVGRALIDEQGAWSLGAALSNVSGVDVQSGSGTFDFFSIRGFDSISSGLIMLDGVAEPESGYYPTYNLRGIEVLKGPAGFLYGKNPLGGAVNLVRKQPLPDDAVAARGYVGSFATTEASVDWNRGGGGGRAPDLRVNALWRESDGFRDDKDSRHLAVNPALTFAAGARTRLTINAEHARGDYAPDGGVPIVYSPLTGLPVGVAGVPRRRSYQAAGDFSEQTVNRLQLDQETRLGERVTLRGKAYVRDLDWRTDGTILRGAFEVGGPLPQVVRDLAVLDDRQRFIGGEFEAIVRFGAAVEHTLLAGVELAHESDEFDFGVQPLADVDLALQPAAFDLGTPFPLASTGDVTNVVISPYIVDQMRFSPHVELLAGVRYDRIDQDGDVTSLFNPVPVSYTRDDSEASPMLGLVVAPREGLTFYANASRSHAPPSTRLADELNPAAREPERATQFELGARRRFLDGRLRAGLAAYRIERENIAITDVNFFTQQSGDQESRGVELELAAAPRPGLHAFLVYGWNDSELTDYRPCVPDASPAGCTIQNYSGNTPILAPEHVARAWISQKFASGLGLAGGARWSGEQYVAENNLFAVDGALTLDASVFYDLPRWRFKIDVRNVTDAEQDYRGIAGADSVLPGEPRSFFAGVECRL